MGKTLPPLTKKQKEMIAYGKANPYALLCADPRLGKSRAAIRLRERKKLNCLVVCPAYLVQNWKKEILKWAPGSMVTTFQKGKEIYDVFDSDYVVTSYGLVQKCEWLFSWADMVIGDEIHSLKAMNTKRTQFFHRCIFEYSTKYLYGLTGTPLKNRVKEFYSLLALMYYNPRLKETKFLDTFPDEITFAEHFSFSETFEIEVSKGKKTFMMPIVKYTGLKNRKELKTWLQGRYIRIRASKGDLPSISYVDTLVSAIDNKKLLRSFRDFFNDKAKIAAEQARRGKKKIPKYELRKMRTSSVLSEHKKEAALRKVPFTIKYVENLLESKKCVLIYSDHTEACKRIATHFKAPSVTGKMPAKMRGRVVNDFQSGKINILCATIGALKEGADLFRAEDMVLNDPSWVPGDITQVTNRMRAIGHKKPRTVHRIMGSPQDEKIWEALEEKIATIDRAT